MNSFLSWAQPSGVPINMNAGKVIESPRTLTIRKRILATPLKATWVAIETRLPAVLADMVVLYLASNEFAISSVNYWLSSLKADGWEAVTYTRLSKSYDYRDQLANWYVIGGGLRVLNIFSPSNPLRCRDGFVNFDDSDPEIVEAPTGKPLLPRNGPCHIVGWPDRSVVELSHLLSSVRLQAPVEADTDPQSRSPLLIARDFQD